MMKRTHQAFAGVFWLSGTLAADFVSVHLGHGEVVSAGMVALGWPLAVPLSAGRNSPDMDQMWWAGPPRCEPGSQRRYYWRGHRGLTHRVWFACVDGGPAGRSAARGQPDRPAVLVAGRTAAGADLGLVVASGGGHDLRPDTDRWPRPGPRLAYRWAQ
jgi:hypothetical protein